MKYCLSSRQPEEILRQADEIRVITKDQNQIFDLLDLYDTTIIYNYSADKPIEDNLKKLIQADTKHRVQLCILNVAELESALDYNLPYFFAQPCKTVDEARTLYSLGANQIMPDTPLTHQLSQLKLLDIPVRYNPTYAHLDNLPRANGISGNWFLPQSVPDYEIYISTIDFGSQPLKREETLFKLYKSEYYGGEIHRLIPDVETPTTADILQANHLSARIDCGQECVYPRGKCRLCYNLLQMEFELQIKDRLQEFLDKNPELKSENALSPQQNAN